MIEQPELISFIDDTDVDGLVCNCGCDEFKVYPEESLVMCLDCQLFYDIHRTLH